MEFEELRLAIPSGAIQLEALLARPAGPPAKALLAVCHPHPLYGGSMDNNVVLALSDAALQEGMSVLRFNFRGVGASGGSHGGGEPETGDVLAVLEAAGKLADGGRVSLAGYSFGAARAAAACQRAAFVPDALVLVSLPLRSPATPAIPATGPHSLLITGDRDPVCPPDGLERLVAGMTPAPDMTVVEGADHSWWGYEAELRDRVGGFLRWYAFPRAAS